MRVENKVYSPMDISVIRRVSKVAFDSLHKGAYTAKGTGTHEGVDYKVYYMDSSLFKVVSDKCKIAPDEMTTKTGMSIDMGRELVDKLIKDMNNDVVQVSEIMQAAVLYLKERNKQTLTELQITMDKLNEFNNRK